MRVVHVNYSDLGGGAGIAAFRFHKELIRQNIDSLYFVRQKKSQENSVIQPSEFVTLRNKANIQLELFFKKMMKIEGSLPIAFLPDLNIGLINKLKPDIVHLHWIHGGFVSFKELSKIKVPIIWTLHDMWVIGNLNHYLPTDVGILYKKSKLEEYKNRWLDRIKNISFITPSLWLKNECMKNSILKNKSIYVIHNGLDLNNFYPIEKNNAKNHLRIDSSKLTLLLGAMGIESSSRKGIDIVQNVLKKLYCSGSIDMEIIIFGSNKKEINNDFYFPTHYLGRINRQQELTYIYSAADIFLLPSRADNLPNTGLEALACGTPIVAYNIGGIPEIIQHKYNGYLATPFDLEDFEKGIYYVMGNNEQLIKNARSTAEEKFDIVKNARKYIDLYNRILNKNIKVNAN
ncbi:MAG: glycosyltransferase [Bacteroidales bacterium]|nr:glycosyltransferase [Bacteroidales bacterium]